MASDEMLSLPDCISHYFLKPLFPFPCLPFVFPPFVAVHIIYRIDGEVDMGVGIFPGRAVDGIYHLAMVFLIKVIGHFPGDCIDIQMAFLYELPGFGGKGENFMVDISA